MEALSTEVQAHHYQEVSRCSAPSESFLVARIFSLDGQLGCSMKCHPAVADKYAFSFSVIGMSVFASKWSLIKDGFKFFFKHEDLHWSAPVGRLISIYLRHHPEFHVIAWIALWSGAVILVLHTVFARLGIQDGKYISALSLGILAICLTYLIGVDQTIRSNPLLQMARDSKTSVKVEYLFCGSTYGTYDSSSDTLTICNSAHDGKSTFSSRESTIRHEVWHIVQACVEAKRSGKWGGFSPVESSILTTYSLPREISEVVNSYPKDSRVTEEEAFKAETFLSDYLIQQEFSAQCLTG